MRLVRLTFVLLIGGLAACGGKDMTCDEGPYQTAVRAPRVSSPEDLDTLDALREMPLPEASPQQPRPEGSPCIDKPPMIEITR